jgi:hypothetical protein
MLLDQNMASQNSKCGFCAIALTDYSDIVPDHICPRGMGGTWRDAPLDNIQVAHWWCNGRKGRDELSGRHEERARGFGA